MLARTKKTYLLWLLFWLWAGVAVTAAGINSANLGNAQPGNLAAYHPRDWSGVGVWDASKLIPAGAKVTRVTVRWSTSLQHCSGVHMYLYNEEGLGTFVGNGSPKSFFNGRSASQKWYGKYFVDWMQFPGNAVYAAPTLTIDFQMGQDSDRK